MKAIIYISNTGSTAEYAKLLGKELNLPVHSLQQAKTNVLAGSEITAHAWDMVLCNDWWSDDKGCSYGDCKNYTGNLVVFSWENKQKEFRVMKTERS